MPPRSGTCYTVFKVLYFIILLSCILLLALFQREFSLLSTVEKILILSIVSVLFISIYFTFIYKKVCFNNLDCEKNIDELSTPIDL